MVKRGQVIAQIGASGSANIPHLHYELRTGTGVDAEGLPSYFSNFRRVLDSKMTIIQRGQIDTGDIIENR
jgi:murein DD-endopeptidase MepM/ murein hydrolase activator NlpD